MKRGQSDADDSPMHGSPSIYIYTWQHAPARSLDVRLLERAVAELVTVRAAAEAMAFRSRLSEAPPWPAALPLSVPPELSITSRGTHNQQTQTAVSAPIRYLSVYTTLSQSRAVSFHNKIQQMAAG